MEYRYLGATGLKVSELSYGAWVTFGNQVDETAAAELLKTAFDAGVNFFDNAEVYAQGQAETVMGAALRRLGLKRSELVISTKIFWGGDGPNDRGLSRKHVLEGTDASLARLGLDYVDVLFCHRADLHTPIEETVRAMDHLISQGKVLYWGTSEWPADRILEAHHVARRERLVPPVVEQPQYNMFHRDRFEFEYAPLFDRIGLGSTIWSPLAGGLLTGKYNAGIPAGSRSTLEGYEWLRSRFEGDDAAAQIEKLRSLEPIAEELGATLAQLAIAWCLHNRNVSTVILGASKVAQLQENLVASEVAERIDASVMERIEAIIDTRPDPEHDWR